MGRALLTVATIFTIGAAALPASAGAARAWRAPQQVTGAATDLAQNPMTRLGDGALLMAWRDNSSSPGIEIQARTRLAAGGMSPATSLGGGGRPAVAPVGPTGGLVAWAGSDQPGQSGTDIEVAEYDAAHGWGDADIVASVSDMFAARPAAAGNAAGDAVVLYGTDDHIYSVRRSTDGTWGSPQLVGQGYTGSFAAGISDSGDAVYAWHDGTTVRTATEPRGAAPSAPVAAGDGSNNVHLAVNGSGAAVIAWVDDTGAVRAALRSPGAAFDPTVTPGHIGGFSDVSDAISADGHVALAWASGTPTSLDGPVTAVGTVAGLGPPEPIMTGFAFDTPIVALDPSGNAIYFARSWNTGEMRAVRRSLVGTFGRPRALIPCPPGNAVYPQAASVDAAGNASFLWRENDNLKAQNPMSLSEDEASSTFGPDPCPPRPPGLTWSPSNPQPGETVTFDATGTFQPSATAVHFTWDLDGDGNYETDTGSTPSVSHAFPAAGQRRIAFRAAYTAQPGGSGYDGGGSYVVPVGVAPEINPPWGIPNYDPRPDDTPDENPWPVGLPPVPPAPPVPPTTISPPPPPAPPAPKPPTPTRKVVPKLSLAAGSKVKLSQLRKGVSVTLTAPQATRVRVSLLYGKKVLVSTEIALRAGVRKKVVLKVAARSAKKVKAGHRLTVVAMPLSSSYGGKGVTRTVTARR